MLRKSNLLPFILFSAFFFCLNGYILSGLATINQTPWFASSFWIGTVLLISALMYGIRTLRREGMNTFFQIVAHIFLIVFVGELVFTFFLLTGDAYRLIGSVVVYFRNNSFAMLSRSTYWIDFALLMFALTVVTFIYGIVRGKYAYRVIKHTLYFDDLPDAFDGFTITQISDVHAGSFTNAKAVQKGIDLINAQKSDLFVFTGDLVNNQATEITPWIQYFSQIKAPYGQFSILGNHDYGDYIKWPGEAEKAANLQQLKESHAKLGFKLLLDAHVNITKGNEQIVLAGVENWGIGFGERGDLKKALAHTSENDFKVLLSHDPTHWDAQVKEFPSKIQLTLSGHTHGMQFGIEAFGIKWSPVKYRYPHWAGLKKEHNRYLHINRGFGFLGFSGRIGIWPEITVIELKKQR